MSADAIDRFVRAARLRVGVAALLTGLASAVAAILAALSALAWWLGPTPGRAIGVGRGVLVLVTMLVAFILLQRRPRTGGIGVTRYFASGLGGLASRVSTALELATDRTPLAVAHRQALARELARTTLDRVLPLRAVVALPTVRMTALVLVLSGLSLLPSRPRAGLRALWTASWTATEVTGALGVLRAVRVRPPEALGLADSQVAPSTTIEVPEGSTVELHFESFVESGLALVDDHGRASSGETGAFRLRVEEPLALRLTTRIDGEDVVDATSYRLLPRPDAEPEVSVLSPTEDRSVDAFDLVPIQVRARDLEGLAEVAMVIVGPDGTETRENVEIGPDGHTAEGTAIVSVADFEVEDGEAISVFVEARDRSGRDAVRSEPRLLTLGGGEPLEPNDHEALEALREGFVALLADRIETPVAETASEDTPRIAALHGATEILVARLRDVAEGRLGEGVRASDRGVYLTLARELEAAVARERRLLGAASQVRSESNEAAIRGVETGLLAFLALLVRAQTDDAARMARELETLRREMASLLAELRRNPTPEGARRLRATLERARRRMQALRDAMARMGEQHPGEFANSGEAELAQSAEALARLDAAMTSGDLDAAAQALTGLEQELDALARSLGQVGEQAGEEQFGPRQRAIADLIDRLLSLEGEQRELARRTEDVGREAARRAAAEASQAATAEARGLAGRVVELRRRLEGVRGMQDREARESALAQLADLESALGHGELGEAVVAAARAEEALEPLDRYLDLERMMFPGHDGHVTDDARVVRQSLEDVQGVRRELEASIPGLERGLSQTERGQLAGDAPRQAAAEAAVSELEEALGRMPMGPVGEEIGRDLDRAESAMREAGSTLESGAVARAGSAQRRAADALTEARRRLESDSGGGGGGGGGGGSDPRSRVAIPGTTGDSTDERRRILDAMREAPPEGTERGVRRYYEELLR